MKFRKKPVVIEAMLFDGMNIVAVCQWLLSHGQQFEPGIDGIGIVTLEGTMLAQSGDWIIRGVAGEFYPCKPGIFADTYEKVDDDE
jgi:hypothetical protein